MSELWTEIWTRPGHASFGRLIDDPGPTEASFHDGVNQIGDGTLQITDQFTRFDEILLSDPDTPANSRNSLVRVFSEEDPTTPIFEWLPNKIYPATAKNDPLVKVEGVGIKALLGHARLEAYDWDGSEDWAPIEPDWNFGGGINLLQNPGFENQPLPNGSFELGNDDYWEATQSGGGTIFDDATLLATKDSPNADSGDWYGTLASVDGPDAGARRTINGLVSGKTYTITGKLNEPTASGDRFRSGISDAATATHTNAYEEDGYWWAELGNAVQGGGASNGTWQDFTITFEATGPTAELVIVYADPGAGPDFRIDTWTMSGEGVGLYPWTPRIPSFTEIFEAQTSVVRSGNQALRTQSTDFVYTSPYTGAQGWARTGPTQTVSVTPGKTYTGEAWVRQDSGSDKTFMIIFRRTTILGPIGTPGSSFMGSKRFVVPSGVWTKLTLTDTADVNEISFEVRWEFQGPFDSLGHQSPVWYVDDTNLYEGLPATSLGDILEQIYDHAINIDLRDPIVWDDGSGNDTTYLTLDFDETVDSNGNAWDTSELKIKLTMRMSYSQIMAVFARNYQYEYRIVPDDVEAGTWLWQVYNPGTMQTDYTAAQTPGIQGGAQDTRRQVNRFIPAGNNTMIEGLGRVTGRAENADLMAALGRMESARIDREAPDIAAVADAADSSIAGLLTKSRSLAYTLTNPPDEPLSAYVLGDLLTIDDPPEVADVDARLIDVVCSYTPNSVEWDVQFGSVAILNPDAAVANAVAGLLGKFEYPDADTVGGGGGAPGAGGAPTVGVAASDASEFSKEKADYQATGTDDHLVIMGAMLDLFNAGGGRLWLSEGTFSCDPDQIIVGYSPSYPVPVLMIGMGESSVIHLESSVTIYGMLVADPSCAVRDLKVEGGAEI